jgi:hypothetical protein
VEGDNKKASNEYDDRFSRLMFGPFPPRQNQNTQNQGGNDDRSLHSQEFDLIQIMENIDTLVSSFEKFKPLMKKITPLFDLFKNK